MKPNDIPQRRIYGEWALGKLAENPLLYRTIVLNEYVNKQNCRFWSEDQPETLQSYQCMQKKSLFGAVYGLDRTSSKLLRIVMIPWDDIKLYFCPKCKSLTCMMCGFNKTVPHSTRNNELIERWDRWTFYFSCLDNIEAFIREIPAEVLERKIGLSE